MITIASIQRAIAAEYGLPVETMRVPDRRGPDGESHPRQLAMALSVLLTDHSKSRIGHYFGRRSYSTVSYAERVVARRRLADARLHAVMRRVTLELARGEVCHG